MWYCKCQCGGDTTVCGKDLRRDHVKSCGCLEVERRVGYGIAAFNSLYGRYRKDAKARGKEFLLSKQDFGTLTKQPCYYCGRQPAQTYKLSHSGYGDYVYSGIDRLDNNKGYTKDNCIPACKICNWNKRDMTEKEFLAWIERVYKYRIEQKRLDLRVI